MPRTTRNAGWRSILGGNVLALGFVSLFTDLSSEMIYPLLPLFIAGLAPTPAWAAFFVGTMEGIAESTASILKIVAGRLSDRTRERKPLTVAGYGLSALARPLMAIAQSGWHVVAIRFMDRIGKGIRTAPRDALIGDSVPPDMRGRAFSFHRAMDHTGAVAGSLLAAVFLYFAMDHGLWSSGTDRVSSGELRAIRWLFALAIVPGFLAMATLVKKVKELAHDVRETARPTSSNTASPMPRRFYEFVGIVVLFALGNSSDLFLLFYGKTQFQMGAVQIIALWVALHLSKVVFSIPGGALSDRYGRRPVIIAGWLVYAAVYLGISLTTETWQFWCLLVAYGAYYGLTEGAEKALVADYVPSEQRGTAFGIYHGAVGLAALPASLLFGVFWGLLGPALAFQIGAGLAGAAGILLLLLSWSGRPAPRPAS